MGAASAAVAALGIARAPSTGAAWAADVTQTPPSTTPSAAATARTFLILRCLSFGHLDTRAGVCPRTCRQRFCTIDANTADPATASGADNGSPAERCRHVPLPANRLRRGRSAGSSTSARRAAGSTTRTGSFFYRGTYHLFFQHHPYGLEWGTMHWGHATSPDLVHWTQQPIALDPGVHPGELWSGNGIVDTGNTSGLKDGAGRPDPAVLRRQRRHRAPLAPTARGRSRLDRDGVRWSTPPGTAAIPRCSGTGGRWVMVVWSDQPGATASTSTPRADLLTWTPRSRYRRALALRVPRPVPAARWTATPNTGC